MRVTHHDADSAGKEEALEEVDPYVCEECDYSFATQVSKFFK